MKYLMLSIMVLSLSGCGFFNKADGYLTGYSLVCVTKTNVMYVQFPSGSAPLYNQDGTLVKC